MYIKEGKDEVGRFLGTVMGTEKMHSINRNDSKDLKKDKMTQGITKPLPKRLYTLSEAAHYLGRTLWSMRELVRKGSIPIVRERKRIFIDVKDLEGYIERNKTTYV